MSWTQLSITLKRRPRGCHLITSEIESALGKELRKYKIGIANIFIQHTSASLTINECADPDVRTDMETVLNRLVPENAKYVHDAEGSDDMPAHAKNSLLGCSLNIPITNGRFAFGTWQGIYLAEHRDSARARTIVVTIQGQE